LRGIVEREGGERGWHLGVVASGGNVSVEALGKMFEVNPEKGERQEGTVGKDGEKVAENVAG
jgi:threonine dehydratase